MPAADGATADHESGDLLRAGGLVEPVDHAGAAAVAGVGRVVGRDCGRGDLEAADLLENLSCSPEWNKIRYNVQYTGFLSYSHAADDKLAPAVQSSLHSFARPWYRLRSVWIFRDKAGMGATPSVWGTIEKALADSEYFLLMASPDSAASHWVQKEVGWWLTNRQASNVLILLTDGEIHWNPSNNDFDWSRTTALPPQLRGRTAQEPLWIDLKWARSEEKLSLRHSRFRGAILDISSTLLNRPKESLDSEDARVFKRNRRWAAAAVIISLLLAVGATTEAFVAKRNAAEAKRQQGIAERQTDLAKQRQKDAEDAATREKTARDAESAARKDAEDSAKEATRQKDAAVKNARESKARELAAYATQSLNEDPERSILLGMYAIDATLRYGQAPVPAAEEILHRAILAYRLRLIVSGRNDQVSSVAWSPNGRLLAMGSWDNPTGNEPDSGTVTVWDSVSKKEFQIPSHAPVFSMAWSPDGKQLATGYHDGTVKVWSIEGKTGKLEDASLVIKGGAGIAFGVAWSPDGNWLASAGGNEKSGKVEIWDVRGKSGRLTKPSLTLTGFEGEVLSVAWSKDGWLATASSDCKVKVWVVEGKTGELTEALLDSGRQDHPVFSVAWNKNGNLLASGGTETTTVWYVHVNAKTWEKGPSRTIHSSTVESVAWSPDGRSLAIGGQGDETGSSGATVTVWHVESGKDLLTLNGGINGSVRSVAWSNDGQHLATGGGEVQSLRQRPGVARVWDVADGQELLTLNSRESRVKAVAWSPDSKWLATGHEDIRDVTDMGSARVWNAVTGQQVKSLSDGSWSVDSVAWNRDGKRLATGGRNAIVWDAESGREMLRVNGHTSSVASVAWSPDGKLLATGGADFSAKVWDVHGKSGEVKEALWTLSQKPWFGDSVRGKVSVAWSRDGKRLATANTQGRTTVWDGANGQKLFSLKGRTGVSGMVAWSWDRKWLATSDLRNTAMVWNAESGKEKLPLKGHTNYGSGVAWNNDGTRLATGSTDGTTTVWDAASGHELMTLRGHSRPINGVAWSDDGTRLATAGVDGTVQVFAMDPYLLLDVARSRIEVTHRRLTADECKHYFQNEECPPLP